VFISYGLVQATVGVTLPALRNSGNAQSWSSRTGRTSGLPSELLTSYSSVAKPIAVPESAKNLSEVESRFGLRRAEDEQFFDEWQQDLPALSQAEQTKLQTLRQRLLSDRAEGDLLEGAVMLLVASSLLELTGFL
ncbi:MAG: hypothetical protein ACKO7W_24185, partial [Elainella sp.]